MDIVIASTNLHKIREIKAILKPQYPFDFLSLLDFPDYIPPEETENTFEGNAFIKATHAARTLKTWVIADDSGLVVPALGGAPGVKSARYAGERASDRENRKKLIKALDLIQENDRTGYYISVIILASPEGVQMEAKGICEGILIVNPKGSQGFGYDPLFLKYDYNKTFAEIDEETKNKISHRRKALNKLAPILETLT